MCTVHLTVPAFVMPALPDRQPLRAPQLHRCRREASLYRRPRAEERLRPTVAGSSMELPATRDAQTAVCPSRVVISRQWCREGRQCYRERGAPLPRSAFNFYSTPLARKNRTDNVSSSLRWRGGFTGFNAYLHHPEALRVSRRTQNKLSPRSEHCVHCRRCLRSGHCGPLRVVQSGQ